MPVENNENIMWMVKKADGIIYGPVDTETLRIWIQENRVLFEDYVSIEDEEWNLVNSIPIFSDLFIDTLDEMAGQNLNSGTHNWFIGKIKSYPIVIFTLSFLLLYRLFTILLGYFSDKKLFLESLGLNIWFWTISHTIIYFLQWLLVVWVASKLPKEKLKQKFLKHPIVTIILFILYITGLPYRLAEYGDGSINIFEIILFYTFVSFFWWLFGCWISSRIFKKQRFQWNWYQKIIENLFIGIPIVYKFILGVIIAIFIFRILFTLLTVVFKYSGQDLKILFGP